MTTYKKIFTLVILFTAIIIAGANMYFYFPDSNEEGQKNVSLSHCKYVSHIEPLGKDFYNSDKDYVIKEIGGTLYRFDYSYKITENKSSILIPLNLILLLMSGVVFGILIFVKNRILSPFERLKDMPYELSKWNLTLPLWNCPISSTLSGEAQTPEMSPEAALGFLSAGGWQIK